MTFVYYFDFDGTLVDTIPGLVDATNHVRRIHGLDAASQDDVESWIGGGLDTLLCAALPNIEVDAALRECFLDYYVGAPLLAAQPYPGVDVLLEKLSTRPLAIVTNKNQVSTEKLLRHLAWQERFDAVVCPDRDVRKPDARVFERANAMMNLTTNGGVMVGDSEFDIEAAQNAGLISIGVTWGYRPRQVIVAAQPDYVVDSVSDLAAVLQVLDEQ